MRIQCGLGTLQITFVFFSLTFFILHSKAHDKLRISHLNFENILCAAQSGTHGPLLMREHRLAFMYIHKLTGGRVGWHRRYPFCSIQTHLFRLVHIHKSFLFLFHTCTPVADTFHATFLDYVIDLVSVTNSKSTSSSSAIHQRFIHFFVTFFSFILSMWPNQTNL